MEHDLADSDPGLAALFLGFARRTGGHDMRWVENTDHERRRLFFRRRPEPNTGEQVTDQSAENWNDP